MFSKGIFSFASLTRFPQRFFNSVSYRDNLQKLFPNYSLSSLKEGNVLMGCNNMKLVESNLALRTPEEMAIYARDNNVPLSNIRQFTIKENLDEVVKVDNKFFVPLELARPHREINDAYADLFKSDSKISFGR